MPEPFVASSSVEPVSSGGSEPLVAPAFEAARPALTLEPRPALASDSPQDTSPTEGEEEVARLEKLLATRAGQVRSLSLELERRSAILHEALWRIGTKVAEETAVLRRDRETAIARALEAEVARAEIGFRLDEALGQLEVSDTAGPVREVRRLQAHVAELNEQVDALRGRLTLAEDDLEIARASATELRRQLEERGEGFELDLMRARAEVGLQAARAQSATVRSLALHGERDGCAARCGEAERALEATQARLAQAERVRGDLREKLEGARADAAELTVAAQARATHVSELGRELGREQHEVRALRAQLEAAVAAQRAERSARDTDVQTWMERLRELELQQQRTASAELSAPQRWAAELRAFLGTLREPLDLLSAALDDLEQDARSGGARANAAFDDTSVGSEAATLSAMGLLEDKLRTSQARIAELEHMLAGASGIPRDTAIAALKGELIDTRANAQRVSDDLAKERARRRRVSVTVRALQAALESGEAPGPWVDELIAVVNEGASMPPRV